MSGLSPLLLALALAMGSTGGTADGLLHDASGVPGQDLAPLVFNATSWNPDGIHFTFSGPQKSHIRVTLTRADPNREAHAHLKRYNVDVEVKPESAAAGLKEALARLVERLRRNEPAGPQLRKLRGKGPERARAPTVAGKHDDRAQGKPKTAPSGSYPTSDETPFNLELWICFLCLLAFLFTTPWLMDEVRRRLASTGRAQTAFWLAAIVVVGIQLFGVPHELVTVFAGYGAVEEAWQLEPMAKYGATTTAIYGPLLHLFGPGTEVIVGTNLALGLCSVFMAAALALRLAGPAGDRPYSAALGLLIFGLAPVLMHDRGTESVLVPMQFFVLGTLLHFDAWLRGGKPAHLVGWIVHMALALNARPEAFVVLPLLLVALMALEGRWSIVRERWRILLMADLALLVLVLPRALSILGYMDVAAEAGDVPGLASQSTEGFWAAFTEKNGLVRSTMLSPALLLVALAAPFLAGPGRRASIVLIWLAILVWQGLSTLDLPEVSISRVQAPALSWTIILACVGVFELRRLDRVKWAGVLAAGLCLFPWPGSAQTLWAPTNAKVFDGFWHRALPEVPLSSKKRCLIGLSMSDSPQDIVTRLYPTTSLKTRSKEIRTFGIETFLDAPQVVLGERCEILYVVGPQCWAKFHGFGAAQPAQATEHAQCQRMRARTVLEAIYEEELPNVGNADFPFYGGSETFTYGLYRVTGIRLRL